MANIGPQVINVLSSTNVAAIPVAGNVTVYSQSIPTRYGRYFAISCILSSSAGSPDITLQLEQSHTTPTTEGSSDTNYVVPNNMSDIFTSRTAETTFIDSLSPVSAPYMRFKIIGNAANNADTTCTIRLCVQEET